MTNNTVSIFEGPYTPGEMCIIIFHFATNFACATTFTYKLAAAIQDGRHANYTFTTILLAETITMILQTVDMFFDSTERARGIWNAMLMMTTFGYLMGQIEVLYRLRNIIRLPSYVLPSVGIISAVIHIVTCIPFYTNFLVFNHDMDVPYYNLNDELAVAWFAYVIFLDITITVFLLRNVFSKLGVFELDAKHWIETILLSGCVMIAVIDIIAVLVGFILTGSTLRESRFNETIATTIHGLHIIIGSMYLGLVVFVARRTYMKSKTSRFKSEESQSHITNLVLTVGTHI